MRQALWITRFDWDDEHGLATLVRAAVDAGITDLLMQARGAGDALYRSRVAPTSAKIAGRLGWEPRWDPLEVACELAEAGEDVRVHAWVNALSGWPATSLEACGGLEPSPGKAPDHLLFRHPEAALVDASGRPMPCPNPTEYVWLSPRHRAVIDELAAVTRELVAGYPIAGVHLDRIRYPGDDWVDPDTRTRGADAVTGVVRAVHGEAGDPLEVTASLMPDYGAVGAEADHLEVYGQDGWRWVEERIATSVMPMVYTPIEEGADSDWTRLVGEHLAAVGAQRCWLSLFCDLTAAELRAQVERARAWDPIGVAWYSAGLIQEHNLWPLVRESALSGR